MNDARDWLKIASPALRLLAVVALMITTVTGAAASPTAQESAIGGVWTMAIGADADSGTAGIYDARFVVTTEDGDYIGECSIKDLGSTGTLQVCHVDVPSDRISLVWQDEAYLPVGFTPVENPIAFDPTTYETGPHNIGAYFHNVPIEGSTASSQGAGLMSMSIMPVEDGGSSVLGVGFTVTTEDGTFLGSCVVPTDFPGGYIPNCSVDVPQNTIIAVWFDPSSSTADLTPVENPVYFDTSSEQDAQMWGPAFAFEPVGASANSQSNGGAVTDILGLLPAIGDVSGGLVEAGQRTRTLPEVTANYTSPAETTQLFTQWEWQQNAITSFALPSNQQAQSGQVNGVYVSIHQFGNPEGSRAALDYSLTEQAAGTSLREIDTHHFGEETRALFGLMDYGNETTLLTQQDGLLIRVSASMLDGDPTAASESIMEGIIQRATSTEAGSISGGDSTGSTNSSGSMEQTWSASVQVNMCDAPPNSGMDMNCHAEGGIVVNISLDSGELVGSCTLGEPQPTPWGTTISLCTVDGLPFNANLVAIQDPATVPPGYVPHVDTLTLQVGEQIPGGGDQANFTFFNVQTGANSSSTATGSVIENFYVGCIPSEACFNATVTVSTEDGEFISSGTCPAIDSAPWVCTVPKVPRGITVVITLDGIVPGYVVEQKPLYWDTTTEPSPVPSLWPGGMPSFAFATGDGSSSSAPND